MNGPAKARHGDVRGDESRNRDTIPAADTPDAVLRWEAFGGTWEVTEVRAGRAVVELRRCDGGEVVESVASDEPEFVRWAAAQLGGPG